MAKLARAAAIAEGITNPDILDNPARLMAALFPTKGLATPRQLLEHALGQEAVAKPPEAPAAPASALAAPSAPSPTAPKRPIIIQDMAQAIRALEIATGEEVRLETHSFNLEHRRKMSEGSEHHEPQSPGPRPDLSLIKKWATDFGATMRRNRDGSYDALAEFTDPNAEGLYDGEAWEFAVRAIKACPGPALVMFKQVRVLLDRGAIQRWQANPQGSADTTSRGGIGAQIDTGDALFVIIPTRYVRLENYARLFDWLEGEESTDYEGFLDKSRAGICIFWGKS